MLQIFFISSCVTTSTRATYLVDEGDWLNNQQRYDEAILSYQAFLNMSKQMGMYRNYDLESEVNRKLVYVYNTQGKHVRALEYAEAAFQLDSAINKNNLAQQTDLRLIGLTHTYIGNFMLAKSFLNRSLDMALSTANSIKSEIRRNRGNTYLALANVDLSIGSIYSSLESVNKSIEIFKQISDERIGLIEGYLIKGNILIILNQLEEGGLLIQKSMQVAIEEGLNTSRHLQSLADYHRKKGELEAALNLRIDALQEAEKSNIKPQIIWSTLRVGDAYSDIGDIEQSMAFFNKGLELQVNEDQDTSSLLASIQLRTGDVQGASEFWTKTGSSLGVGIAYLKLGTSFLESNNYDSALLYAGSAQELFQRLGIPEGEANANLVRSQAYISTGQNNQALQVINETNELTNQPVTKWQLLYQKGLAHEALQQNDSAIQSYLAAIDIIEELRGAITIEEFRSTFFDNKTKVYGSLIRLILEGTERYNYNGRNMPAGEFAFLINERSRSRTFLDLLGTKRIQAKDASDTLLLAEEQQYRIKIRQLTQQIQKNNLGGRALSDVNNELEKAKEAHEKVIASIQEENTVYSSMLAIDPPGLDEIQAHISDNSAIVEYYIGDEKAFIWVIDRDSIRFKVLDQKSIELVYAVKAARNLIEFKINSRIDHEFRKLYDQLFEPIESWVSDRENLIIIPHGPLHFLPFQSLINKEDQFLVQSKVLSSAPSAAVFYHNQTKSTFNNEKVLSQALGDMQVQGQDPLPGTEYEIKQISQFYEQFTSRSREENQEAFFKENAEQYEIIHIATHGILSDKEPLYSYLLMVPDDTDDGRLTVNEIMDLDIQSNIVVLSACETGLGELSKGDELVGLSRAFLYAGTKAIIVSLWTVDDLSTSILMTKFHQYLNQGMGADQALTFAQRAILNDQVRDNSLKWESELEVSLNTMEEIKSNPYYWAPFVIIGTSDINP